ILAACHSDRSRSASDGEVEESALSRHRENVVRNHPNEQLHLASAATTARVFREITQGMSRNNAARADSSAPPSLRSGSGRNDNVGGASLLRGNGSTTVFPPPLNSTASLETGGEAQTSAACRLTYAAGFPRRRTHPAAATWQICS